MKLGSNLALINRDRLSGSCIIFICSRCQAPYRGQTAAYQNKQNYEAIELYSKSLQNAEAGSNSETLALAFANRSAVLLALGKNEYVEAALR